MPSEKSRKKNGPIKPDSVPYSETLHVGPHSGAKNSHPRTPEETVNASTVLPRTGKRQKSVTSPKQVEVGLDHSDLSQILEIEAVETGGC